jgi:site-specific DNA-cytosine methylase
LEGRESKVVENVKKAMFIKGGRTNEAVSKALKEMVFYFFFDTLNSWLLSKN